MKDASGANLAAGQLLLTLSQEATATDPALILGVTVTCTISGGAIQSCSVRGNDTLSPAGTYYKVRIVTSAGQEFLPERNYSITGATWDLGASTPLATDTVAATAYQIVADEGVNVAQRQKLNFAGVGVACSDDSANARTNCSITGGGGGGSTHQLDGVALTAQDPINFQDTAEVDWTNPAAGNIQAALKAASIADSKIAASGITTRSKLPAPLVYDDEPTIYGAFKQDFGAAALEIPNAATLPATCAVGEIFYDTDAAIGVRYYLCTATNTWTPVDNPFGIAVDDGELASNYSGIGACTNQFPRTLNDNAAPTCADVAPADFASQTANTVLAAPDGVAGDPTFRALVDADIPAAITRDAEWPSATATLTNKTLDAEGTGNVITTVSKVWIPAAVCQNATATLNWDTPTTNPAVAACITGTNTQKGVADFADGAASLSMQMILALPSDFTGAIDAKFKWLTTAITGDVVWQVATVCVADGETDDPAFNAASTVTDTAKATANQTNDATITAVTITGCAAGELLHLKLSRDSAHAADTLAATARLVGVELTMRRAQ